MPANRSAGTATKNVRMTLSTSTCAHASVRGKRCAKNRAPRSVRHQRARGGRSTPCGWTPGGGNCENTYFALEGKEGIDRPTGPAIEADAQHAVHGPQCEFLLPSLPCLASVSAE